MSTPDIPAHLVGCPRSGGLVVPWVTPSTREGIALFGQLTDLAVAVCLLEECCQICGNRLLDRAVLFARESDLRLQCTPEPPVCPPCAAYSIRACPMLAGSQTHYRATTHPALAGTPPTTGALLRQGASAEPWHAVWVRIYDVINHPILPETLAASWRRIPPLRIRPVTTGRGQSAA
ncbi:hypothetical protein [Cryptosporangium arvum]|uniref:Uncharacterized protein n=1 Tax=Cryptosporangium arvum DSM 44712 TaxID=927661 RepID=A0A010YP66_9ACTN|nr:hypothetical protein [Cryptosporangium arvum]EXG81980.1 hypothetical protein CryarDRAFT_3107 [Cryptosporangium arvum DSM 44712]